MHSCPQLPFVSQVLGGSFLVCCTMPVRKAMKKAARKVSFARLSPLAKGRIIGMREAGTERKDIAKQVKKKDGRSPSILAVDNVLGRFKEQPDWDGIEEREAGGRPRDLSPRQEAQILKILLQDVGKLVVSATHVKSSLPDIRSIPDRTIQRTFERLGYAYLYRRAEACWPDPPAKIANILSNLDPIIS